MKVHIILDDAVRQNAEAKQAVLERLQSEIKLSDVNLARFERHGILSGELPREYLVDAERIPGVKVIVPDETKRILR